MATATRQARMPSPERHGTVLALLTAALVAFTVAATAAPAGAAERREPPNVRGATLPEAEAEILEQWYPNDPELTPTIRVAPDPLPDQVSPESARVVDQSVVEYLENGKGEAVIDLTAGSVVPDLVGRTREQAQALVDALALSLKPSGDGLVQTQDPAAETLVQFGTTVVAVLVPPPPDTRTVPPLLGLTEAQARADVEGVELRLEVGESSGEGERTVATQDPEPGATLETGGVVTVTLRGAGTASSTVTVPDVTGLELDAVRGVLEAGRLAMAVDRTGDQPGDGVLSVRQDPAAGTSVQPGSTVSVAFAVVDAAPVSWWVWPAGATVLAVLVAGLWLLRSVRSPRRPPREPPPAPADVTVRPHPDPAPAVSLHPQAADPELVVRIVPGPDLGRLTLVEEPS